MKIEWKLRDSAMVGIFGGVVAWLLCGCASGTHPAGTPTRPGHPTINEYSLVRFNFSPRIQAKIGGSDTEVFVTNENNGGSGTIEKETPIHATQNTPTEVKGTVTP